MPFEWDSKKNHSNLHKHGIRLDEAKQTFAGPVLTRVDDRQDYGEVREISIGRLSPGTTLVVLYPSQAGFRFLVSSF